MNIHLDEYDVLITTGPAIDPNSSDNYEYDLILNPFNVRDDFSTTLLIEISHWEEKEKIALDVPYYTRTTHCAVSDNECVIILLDYIVCKFDPSRAAVTQFVEITNTMGNCWELYEHNDKLIIYGETDVICLDRQLHELWRFSGRDIFVRYEGDEPAFVLKDDRICLTDFLDDYYEINYDGKVLKYIQSEN